MNDHALRKRELTKWNRIWVAMGRSSGKTELMLQFLKMTFEERSNFLNGVYNSKPVHQLDPSPCCKAIMMVFPSGGGSKVTGPYTMCIQCLTHYAIDYSTGILKDVTSYG